jgi:hypothetical protein
MTREEIEKIVESTDNFNAYVEDISSLNGKALDLVMEVAGVDGEEWTDEECLEIIKEITDLATAYRNTHPWN